MSGVVGFDDEDLDDALVMADALSHLFCDESRRREPDVRLELYVEPEYHNHLVTTLGRWTLAPWTVPHARMQHLHPSAPQRQSGKSTADGYLEAALQTVIRGLDAWKKELADQ